jgi:hypothetical protein
MTHRGASVKYWVAKGVVEIHQIDQCRCVTAWRSTVSRSMR